MSPLVPVFLLICSPYCSSLMDYTCLSDMNPSPGVSLPRGDTEVQVGSPSFPLSCHLNPNHPEYLSGVRARDLAFLSNSTRLKSSILDETSISSKFSPSIEGVTDVSCVIISDNSIEEPLNKGVCTQRILVGHPPLPITDFSCVSENWLSLNCTWTEPTNPVPTHYDLHFRTPGKRSNFKRCPSINNLEWLLKRSIPPSLHMCYVNYKTIPQYRHVTKKYDFYVNATNSLNPGGNISRHTVDHFSIVRPGPATDLSLTSSGPDRLQVSWNISRDMVHFPPGLRQLVRYQSQWDQDQWTEVDTSHLDTANDFFHLYLPEVYRPYTKYTVEVSMLSALPTTPSSLNSSPVQDSLLTRPAPPSRSPRTTLASFETIGQGAERTVIVYWQMLADWEQNGPQFSYEVTNVVEEESPVPLIPLKVTQSYAEFESLTSTKSYSFSITSRNSAGMSSSAASVVVPPSTTTAFLLPRSVTKVYQDDDLFILSWLPPLSPDIVTSYTLFWCLSSSGQDRPYQCSGHLDWKTITTMQLNGSLSHSLLLPLTDVASPVYQLAVAANTDMQSSGMQWTTCTIKNDRGVATQVTDVSVDTVSARGVVVRWRLDCSQMTGLVNSFLVEFCRLEIEGGECSAGTKKTRVVKAGTDRLEIAGLNPYSYYSFTVRVEDDLPNSRSGTVLQSRDNPPSLPVSTLTLPSAPGTPPSSLSVSKLTSSNATLHWEQPSHPNGEISKYLVRLSKLEPADQSVEPIEEILENMVVLINLSSFTRYLVEVSACTFTSSREGVLCGKHWARQQFTTLVGTPGTPNTPKVKLVNNSAVEVEWDADFQLGAPTVARWDLRVIRGEGEEIDAHHELRSGLDTRRVSLSLEQVGQIQGWGPDCTNSSVYMELYYFSVRAEVTNSEGEEFVGPWSEQQVQHIYCTQPLPWIQIVLVATLLPVSLLCMCAIVYGSCSWYRKKLSMIKKIQGGLDSRGIGPVGHIVAPQVRAEYELGRVPPNREEFIDSDMEDGQNTVLLRHKNSSISSQDSGVSSQPPASPSHQDCTRQTSSIPSVVSGYISMGAPGTPLSPVTVPAKEPQVLNTQQAADLGYCRVGHLDQTELLSVANSCQSYVPFTAIRPVPKVNSPGYISLGQVSELVLQPDKSSMAYSRVGVVGGSHSGRVDTSIHGVTRLQEEQLSSPVVSRLLNTDFSKAQQVRLSLDKSVESSSKEYKSPPYSRGYTYV